MKPQVKTKDEPLRGEAAWRAQKLAIADRNKAAHARGREERVRKDAEFEASRRAAEKRDRAERPAIPGQG
jgi:hypothetical protein